LAACLFGFFWRASRANGSRPYHLFLLVLFLLVFLQRFGTVRPHLFSFLLVAGLLYILEHRPDRAWLLPPLGVLQCNLHGIEYPVLLLVLGAYLSEAVRDRVRGR